MGHSKKMIFSRHSMCVEHMNLQRLQRHAYDLNIFKPERITAQRTRRGHKVPPQAKKLFVIGKFCESRKKKQFSSIECHCYIYQTASLPTYSGVPFRWQKECEDFWVGRWKISKSWGRYDQNKLYKILNVKGLYIVGRNTKLCSHSQYVLAVSWKSILTK